MSAPASLVIGIDAGATKTAAMAGRLDGEIDGWVRTEPSAIVGLPDARALGVLQSVLDRFAPDRAAVAQVVIGLSGVDFPDEHAAQHAAVAGALGLAPDRLILVNDSVVALAGAAREARATLVQHGTEVTTAFRTRRGEEAVFDSVGIADCFDVRLKAVPLVARMLDGRAPRTALCDAVITHCGVSAADFPRWMVRDPAARERILRVAPVIFEAWIAGDPAAAGLVGRAVEDYVATTAAMAERMGPGPFEACFGGGTLLQGGPRLMAAIASRLGSTRPDATVSSPAGAPEEGALSLAREAALGLLART